MALAVPLLLAALGEIMAEKAGVINVGIEGMVLAAAGVALAALLALLAVRLGSDQAVVGMALFAQNALGYLAWLLIPLCWFFLFRTRPGLRLRAAGESLEAADGAGVRIGRVRTLATLWGGGWRAWPGRS